MMWHRLGQSFLDLLYPPLCLHCNEGLDRSNPVFCRLCLELLSSINPVDRCPYCFSADFSAEGQQCCLRCSKSPPVLDRMAAVFDYEGPASSLVKAFKYGGQSYLAKGAGAFLAAQFFQLDWPMPDVIIPMPMATLRRIERGYNQSLLLADSLGVILNRPVLDLLKRQSGEFSQAGLTHAQRMQLKSDSFSVKRDLKLYDQCVLLVDDVMTTGSSLNCCAEALRVAYPAKIHGLTLCRAIE